MPTTSSPILKLRPTIQRRRRRHEMRRRPRPIGPVGQQQRTLSIWTEQGPSSPSLSSPSSTASPSSQSPPENATSLDSSQHLSSAEFRELRRLACLLPAHLQIQNPQAQPALLVNNAAQYIAQLTATVLARVQSGSLPKEVLDQLVLPAAPRAATIANNGPGPVRGRRQHSQGGRPQPSSLNGATTRRRHRMIAASSGRKRTMARGGGRK